MNIISKPSDSKRYVPCNSNHPKPCIRKIPFCLTRRICTILVIRNKKLIKLRQFKARYPENIVEKGI